METKEITVREHLRQLVNMAVSKATGDNSKHEFMRVVPTFRPDETNDQAIIAEFTIYNDSKRMRLTALDKGYRVESEIAGHSRIVQTVRDVVDAVYTDIERMRLEPCDAPPTNAQEFIDQIINDVKGIVRTGDGNKDIQMTALPGDDPRVVYVDMRSLSAQSELTFIRYAAGSHPNTDRGCIEIRYEGQQEPTLITDNKSRYDRLTSIAEVVEHEMEQVRENASDDLKELKAEQAMEQ